MEIARDVAAAFNRTYIPLFNLPQASTQARGERIVGIDGRKMSKSYGNEIPLLAHPDTLRRRVMRIVTDSRQPVEPKDPERCNVFSLYRHFADADDVERLHQRYLAGGVAYREVKETLADLLIERFSLFRKNYEELSAEPDRIYQILDQGSRKAREKARHTLHLLRKAVGAQLS